MMRNTTLSILKAIGIILMVMGHASCPVILNRMLNEFHMPLFFMAAGYFFSVKYIDEWPTFVKKRIKGLYFPFVKWSVVFLLFHNLLFEVDILNEQFGNTTGGVLKPYSWHIMQQRLWNIVTAMSGYDEFIGGAFWFFRALLVASLLYLFLFKLIDNQVSRKRINLPGWIIPVLVCLTALLLTAWKTGVGLKVPTLVQGGYRDLIGTFFFGCGYLCKLLQKHYTPTLLSTVFFAAVVLSFSLFFPASMVFNPSFVQFVSLPVPAICGVLMSYNISVWINTHDNLAKRFLVYCGNNTLYIFVFHFMAFKLASVCKIMYYGLEWKQIGCHPIIHAHPNDGFWIIYTIVGVAIPLLGICGYRKIASRMASTIR